jgi:hypothetical protein
MLAIYDGGGRLLAEARRDEELTVTLPSAEEIKAGEAFLYTVSEPDDTDDRHRMAVRRAVFLHREPSSSALACPGISLGG